MADNKLFFYACTLLGIGIIFSYSLSSYAVIFYGYGEFHFLIRELISGIIGIFIMWSLSYLNVEKHFSIICSTILIVSLFLMILIPFLPDNLALASGGAKRWIRLSFFSISPIEFFKIGYIFFLSWSFSRKFHINDIANSTKQLLILLPHIAVFLLVALLISILQNDLGQVVLLAIASITLIILAGGRFSVFALGIIFISSFASIFIVLSPHRILRVKTWWANMQNIILHFMPSNFAEQLKISNLPEAIQINSANSAFYNGGFFGQGLGNGILKLGFLSEVHTDFVLAGISEEIGFFGLFVCITIFFLLIYRMIKIAVRLQNSFHYLFCAGIISLIAFSFIINSFGIVGITPVKGIAVPFFSYGGSNIIATCFSLGIILALSKNVSIK